MKTTFELLDLYRKTLPAESWYGVAKELEITQQQLLKIRNGTNRLTDKGAIKIAERLGFPQEIVFLWLQVERMKGRESAPAWQQIATNYEQALSAKVA